MGDGRTPSRMLSHLSSMAALSPAPSRMMVSSLDMESCTTIATRTHQILSNRWKSGEEAPGVIERYSTKTLAEKIYSAQRNPEGEYIYLISIQTEGSTESSIRTPGSMLSLGTSSYQR